MVRDPQPAMPAAVKIVVLLLLAAFAVQASTAARRDSVTLDEFVHLPIGYYALQTGDYSQDPINPHLARMLAAAPLLLAQPEFAPDPSPGPWAIGYDLMLRNPGDYHGLFVMGRSVVILLAVVLGGMITAWAAHLYGWPSAVATAVLFAFSPEMLAHGHLVTLDMPGALGFATCVWATWWLLRKPRFGRAALLGGLMGVSTLFKLSSFVLGGLMPLLIATRVIFERSPSGKFFPNSIRWALLIATAGVTALFVLNLGYGFDGTMERLSDARLARGGILDGWANAAPELRLPLPQPFINGVDMVLNVGRSEEPKYFLAGELSADGWWYYHLAAFALKTPIPLLLGTLAAFGIWIAGSSAGHRDYCIFISIAVIFAVNSMFNSLHIGVRHVLPAYPLLFVAVSPLIARPIFSVFAGSTSLGKRGAGLGVAACLLWYVAGTLTISPMHLQYFNEFAGGSDGGHEWLVDSNIDWGQDLIRLREYMDENDLPGVQLAYFGRVDPSVYGINFAPLERETAAGTVVISASFLMGRPYFWFHEGRMDWVPHETYAWLREHEPVARVGSMFVFESP